MSKLRHVALLLAGVVLVAIVPGVASALPDFPPSVGTSAIAPQAWAPSGVAGAEVQGTVTATRIVPATATSAAQENIITCTVDKQYRTGPPMSPARSTSSWS
ncbi:hypothetical protein ACFXGA_08445 [Actinosynnema sp. NPDC059335]|uniref:hypothetical protein n=1 Tax=Actinosynnema sp. NPDC059335 TaxID=3346804 RepID=UPI00366BC57A